MEKLIKIQSVAIPLAIDNCDTDQIMPKQFLRGLDKSGLDRGLFYNMRFLENGEKNNSSIFNALGYENAKILVGGPNFGCGSSREHAVWGLMQYGFRVIIAPSYGEIFYSNCFNNGLLAAKVSEADGIEILNTVGSKEPVSLTVDLERQTIINGAKTWSFTVAERHRYMLMNGLDLVGSTLQDKDAIEAFRLAHEAKYPWMAGLAAKAKQGLKD